MHTPLATKTSRSLLVVSLSLFIAGEMCACRRNAGKNTNANGNTSSSTANDPEQAKRQAQSLVEQGKELYKNDQDEQAAELF